MATGEDLDAAYLYSFVDASEDSAVAAESYLEYCTGQGSDNGVSESDGIASSSYGSLCYVCSFCRGRGRFLVAIAG